MGKKSQNMDDLNSRGYSIVKDDKIKSQVANIREKFELVFRSLFGVDIKANRNLLKRFVDSPCVGRMFSGPELEGILKTHFGLQEPVFCGPAVGHYTSNDITGAGYGLGWHQDYPSMASSINALIVWVNLYDSNADTHSLEVSEGGHKSGLLKGTQSTEGYVIDAACLNKRSTKILEVEAGSLVFFTPYLPHRTYTNPQFSKEKFSISQRFDDLHCSDFQQKRYRNAYVTCVDRTLFRSPN